LKGGFTDERVDNVYSNETKIFGVLIGVVEINGTEVQS
jgi:hypothetical protein